MLLGRSSQTPAAGKGWREGQRGGGLAQLPNRTRLGVSPPRIQTKEVSNQLAVVAN